MNQMLPYSIILLAVSALLFVLSGVIYRGKTDLIHSYHQSKVQDKAAYGKAFGKALSVMALAPLISGAVGLFADSKAIAAVAVAILILGLLCGICLLAAVQRKYNKGIF